MTWWSELWKTFEKFTGSILIITLDWTELAQIFPRLLSDKRGVWTRAIQARVAPTLGSDRDFLRNSARDSTFRTVILCSSVQDRFVKNIIYIHYRIRGYKTSGKTINLLKIRLGRCCFFPPAPSLIRSNSIVVIVFSAAAARVTGTRPRVRGLRAIIFVVFRGVFPRTVIIFDGNINLYIYIYPYERLTNDKSVPVGEKEKKKRRKV